MDRPTRRVRDSRTEFSKIVLSADVNGTGCLFGGRLMEWIDVVAAVAARRHSGCDVVTASVDSLRFQAPAGLNDTVTLIGTITYVGNTSMEVRVDTFVESLSGERTRVNRAYLTMVAMAAGGGRSRVPALLPETDEEMREWDAGALRRAERLRDCRQHPDAHPCEARQK